MTADLSEGGFLGFGGTADGTNPFTVGGEGRRLSYRVKPSSHQSLPGEGKERCAAAAYSHRIPCTGVQVYGSVFKKYLIEVSRPLIMNILGSSFGGTHLGELNHSWGDHL